MPIRPENRDRCLPNWDEISAKIRIDRAGGRCECTGQCGVDHKLEAEGIRPVRSYFAGPRNRCQARNSLPHHVTRSQVVLTVMHLDHQPENVDDSNLLAGCQGCHNRYDGPTPRQGTRDRENARAGQGDMFKGDG